MPRTDHSNEEDHIRRNPQDAQGKVRGNAASDVVGDETGQVDDWRELEAESAGETASRMDGVGNAQDALLAGTGDLDNVQPTRATGGASKRGKPGRRQAPGTRLA